MNKKLISLVLALVLTLSVGFAFAENASPSTSPSTSPVTSATLNVDATVSSLGVELPADFLATIPQPSDASEEEIAAAEETMAAISAFMTANGLPVVEYFGLDVQAAISEKLPLNMAAEDLVMREFTALPLNEMAAAYDSAYGDIILQMSFAVDFAEGDAVVPVLGIMDATTGTVTWIALDAVVNADGFVEITFTADVLSQIAEDSIVMLAVLA